MKFCGECGCEIKSVCPQCHFTNPPNFKFCGECGARLSAQEKSQPKELSLEDKLDKLQRYLPKGVTEKILAQRGRIEGERKHITVLFCDLVGFTPMVEKLGYEDTYSLMDQVYEILIHKVHEYGGTVNEMTGDGVMALFGAPIALEDAPQRAIRSAISIHKAITSFSNQMKGKGDDAPSLKMRIGINTGHVVVGTLGNDLRVEFKAVGDTVNLASRMEGLAEPGATYVTKDTFKITEGFFRFEALGEKEVKGKKEPISVYRVIAPSNRRTRFDVSAERGLTPFIGREREVDLLLEVFERAKAGRGQAIFIMSEAGVGKSRLLYEFRKAVANDDATLLEGKCLSYSRGVAYHPVTDILKANFDILEGDGDAEIKNRVKIGLKVLGIDENSTLPYFLELLSVKNSGMDKIMMSPEGIKNQIAEALKRIVLKGSEMKPLIMVFEDLHWVDKSSEEVMKYVLESIPGARVLLIFTYRPEFVQTWGAKSYYNQITLNRLSNPESVTMVSRLLDIKDIDRNFEQLIMEKAEGVPFFIEEFIKSLKDLKIIEKKDNKYSLAKGIERVTIPSTIQDVIMARVDSVPEAAKEVLQTGSVIEREFTYDLIKRVTNLPEQELLSHLSALKDSELIYERGIYPQSTYIFKHALTQEVVYDSILTKRKKILHREIAKAIEKSREKHINEYYGILAEHFIKSENYEEGAKYSNLAGKKALKRGSPYDAIDFAEKTIRCLESLPQTEEIEKRSIDARTRLGLFYTQVNYHGPAKEVIDPIFNLAIKHNYKRRLCQIYTIVGAYNYMVQEDFQTAFENLSEALKISEQIGHFPSFAQANYWLALALSLDCKFEKALHHFNKCLDIAIAANHVWGIISMKSVISFFVYHPQGRADLSYQASEEALELAEESADIYSKAMANVSHGVSCYCRGFIEEAKKHLSVGSKFCERINVFSWNAMAEECLAEINFEIGKYQESETHWEKTVRLVKHNKFLSSWENSSKISAAKAKMKKNENDIDLESLYDLASKVKVRIHEGRSRKNIGEILLNFNDHTVAEAEDWIKKAIEADEKNDIVFYLGKDYALYAELFKRKKDKSKAKENLAKAIGIFKECGADGWVEKYEKELAII
jgi:class 3 adenylate cyclase/tetratricopeptide (TPR) repeat protein